MARAGRHPYRHSEIICQPERITVAMITCIPNQVGYYAQRLDILKLCISSLIRHADLPFDFLVFDNGSAPEIVQYLVSLERGVIQYLILSSRNLGLMGGYNAIMGAAPGEIIAFSNDDVFYYPNWLSPQVKILDSSPDVGLVSGCYAYDAHRATAEIAQARGYEVRSDPAPLDWLPDFCESYSKDPEIYLKTRGDFIGDRLIVLKDGGSVYAGGVPWQWLMRRQVAKEIEQKCFQMRADLQGRYDTLFHETITQSGYLRVSTPQLYSMHMGNVLTSKIVSRAKEYGITIEMKLDRQDTKDRPNWVMRHRFTRGVARRIYDRLHRLIYY